MAFNDPYEATNRAIFEATVLPADRALLRPAGQAANQLPPELTDTIVNFSDNASLPGMVVNGLLQGDIGGAGTNAMRFIVNTLVGVGGLLDPADAIGLFEEKTDFGETLAVWGVPEGAFIMVPVLGPYTERDAAGEIVDIFLDPLSSWGTETQDAYSTAARVGEIVVERGRFSDTADSIFYESADPYAQARLLYLQNRRFELGEAAGNPTSTEEIDPFIDPFAEPFQ